MEAMKAVFPCKCECRPGVTGLKGPVNLITLNTNYLLVLVPHHSVITLLNFALGNDKIWLINDDFH